jgi:putative methyltransferase (TIGR04325 family)
MTKRTLQQQTLSIIRSLLPPILGSVYRKLRPRKNGDIIWRGNFKTWDKAREQCAGYDSPDILAKTKAAILKVKAGEAAFERDTVLFDKAEYNWLLLTILLKSANECKGRLSVADFGGSLGSTYFQNVGMLKSVADLEWSVIEQAAYINVGNEEIADGKLKFYPDIDTCLKHRKPKVLLLSSVLQYIEQPYQLLNKLLVHTFDYVIISRTTFINGVSERITVQKVPKSIYEASYPAWFLNQDKFLATFNNQYKLITEFESYPGYTMALDEHTTGHYHDYVFIRTTIDA